MAGIVGVRFKQAGRVYYFDPGALEIHPSDWVVVSSAKGQSLAQVIIAPGQVLANDIKEPLKPILRKAVQEDVELASDLQQKEREVVRKSSEIVAEMTLPMKVIAAECNMEANQVTVFFRAEERVDFRDLVKRLSTALKMRVELRQAGPRDAAKMLGGMGRCGRTLCCATFLTELTPVSIKMAKEQDLPLNPTKISGVCGRLLCCLSYEVGDYRAAKAERVAAAKAAAAAAPAPLAAAAVNPAAGAQEGKEEPAKAAPRPGGARPVVQAKPSEQDDAQKKRRRPRRRKKKPLSQTALGQTMAESQPLGSQSVGPVPEVRPSGFQPGPHPAVESPRSVESERPAQPGPEPGA
ncbi:MAG: regulatory iron-sulfur-containing complex subunit RicT [Dehalococcoidia bacterium]|nr:regulatory iron-sulfur-containing complex subunit RicT [Dehalococcoidia bacterium]